LFWFHKKKWTDVKKDSSYLNVIPKKSITLYNIGIDIIYIIVKIIHSMQCYEPKTANVGGAAKCMAYINL